MVKDIFADVLDELGKILNIPLAPDRHNACLIKFPQGLSVHMQFDPAAERILVVSDLGVPPPGRYRENLFREALKANGLPPPKNGIFAYSKKGSSLVLYDSLSIKDLSGQKLADFLTPFMQRADVWRLAITRGETPSFLGNELSFGSTSGSGMFGLR